MKRTFYTLAIIGVCAATFSTATAQRLFWLGTTLDGRTHERSEAKDVSNDGTVVGTFSRTNGGSVRAFVWDANRGLRSIPLVQDAFENAAWGISSDGRWIVGWQSVGLQVHAYRWHVDDFNSGTRFGNSFAQPRNISDTGHIVVGSAFYLGGYYHCGFTWDGQYFLPLQPINGGDYSFANAVNGRGTRAVGVSVLSGVYRATLWEIDRGQVVDLGGFRSQAISLSDDARIVVGSNNYVTEYPRASRWVDRQGPFSIHTFSGNDSTAYDISGDGRIIVGRGANGGPTPSAFLWTEQEGMVDLNIRYANLLDPGSRLIQANAISKNGRYIVGYGRHRGVEQAFVLELPGCTPRSGDVNNDGCVDDADLLQLLFNFGSTGSNAADINCDNTVDDADLLIVLFNFGQGC